MSKYGHISLYLSNKITCAVSSTGAASATGASGAEEFDQNKYLPFQVHKLDLQNDRDIPG